MYKKLWVGCRLLSSVSQPSRYFNANASVMLGLYFNDENQ